MRPGDFSYPQEGHPSMCRTIVCAGHCSLGLNYHRGVIWVLPSKTDPKYFSAGCLQMHCVNK